MTAKRRVVKRKKGSVAAPKRKGERSLTLARCKRANKEESALLLQMLLAKQMQGRTRTGGNNR